MKKRVHRQLIDTWVQENGPDGVSKLALKSGVSSSMISKVRVGRVPFKIITRRALAVAIGVEESALFPDVRGRSKAS